MAGMAAPPKACPTPPGSPLPAMGPVLPKQTAFIGSDMAAGNAFTPVPAGTGWGRHPQGQTAAHGPAQGCEDPLLLRSRGLRRLPRRDLHRTSHRLVVLTTPDESDWGLERGSGG